MLLNKFFLQNRFQLKYLCMKLITLKCIINRKLCNINQSTESCKLSNVKLNLKIVYKSFSYLSYCSYSDKCWAQLVTTGKFILYISITKLVR